MAQSNWEADKMLDVYIHDYLLKRKLHASAEAFMNEGKVAMDPVAIDAPGGFLFEWWSVFWDIFIARTNGKHSESAAAYIEAQQTKSKVQQEQVQMQQLQFMQQRNAHMQQRNANHPSLNGAMHGMNAEGMMGQPSASVLAMKLYEERMKTQQHSADSETSSPLVDANRMALLKSATNPQGHSLQGNYGNMSNALNQIQGRTQLPNDIKTEASMGAAQKSLDPSSIYGQAMSQSKSGLASPGVNQGVSGLPLKGWPLTGIDQLRPNLSVQGQKPNMQNQNQMLLASQQQQVLAQALSHGNIGNSSNYGDMDPRRFGGLPRGSLSAKDGQSSRNDGPICSPGQVQSSSPKVKMAQFQQSSSQPQDPLQQQQQQPMQQNNKKRKQHSSGAATSTGTGNTLGPSPNSPPSTHTPGDGITTNNMQHVNTISKGMLMCGAEGTVGLAASSTLLEDIEPLGDVGSFDDNVESFLSQDCGDGRDLYGTVKQSPTPNDPKKESSKGFSFGEFGCIRPRISKVTCCHFSSDGKILASAGLDKKAILWNMDTLQTENTSEEHQSCITDIRFRPNSSQLATSSYDKSVRLWDAANPSYCMQAYTAHNSPIMSLDFHPKKTDMFCFCDEKNEIRYCTISPFSCTHVTKGATTQLRFQPRTGQFLATASDKVVSVFDVETDRLMHSFQGHFDMVTSVCWDVSGEYLTSVSHDSVKVWSLASGQCIHELSSNGGQFHSCTFHPSYSTLLVIGGNKSLELWNFAESKSMTVPAHENIVTALAHSFTTGMVASASHDGAVKLWK